MRLSIFFGMLLILFTNIAVAEVKIEPAQGSTSTEQSAEPLSKEEKQKLIIQGINDLMVLDKQLGETISQINKILISITDRICNLDESTILEAIQLAETDLKNKKEELKNENNEENKKNIQELIKIGEDIVNKLRAEYQDIKKSSKVKCN